MRGRLGISGVCYVIAWIGAGDRFVISPRVNSELWVCDDGEYFGGDVIVCCSRMSLDYDGLKWNGIRK